MNAKDRVLLIADDDEDDIEIALEVLSDITDDCTIHTVNNGVELMDYLRGATPRQGAGAASSPSLILLDLKMPRKDGHEALEEIKTDPDLKLIPVVIVTTSKDQGDIYRSYESGANSYVVKPGTLDALTRTYRAMANFWLKSACTASR